VVKGLEIDALSRERIGLTLRVLTEELTEERDGVKHLFTGASLIFRSARPLPRRRRARRILWAIRTRQCEPPARGCARLHQALSLAW
jgi:hypothetical protein